MNKFFTKIKLSIVFCLILNSLTAQQIQYRSPMAKLDFAFNPAMTAAGQVGQFGATHRQQWVSFDGAPRTMSAFIQTPIVYEKMSAGFYVRNDREGAFQTSDISLSYNYKIEIGLFRNDQLSIGISGGGKQSRFDVTQIRSQSSTDPTTDIMNGADTRLQFGGGLFYVSDKDVFDYQESAFYFGVGGKQLIPFQTDIFQGEGYSQTIHTNAILGALFINDFWSFRPEIWVDYAINTPIQGAFSLTIERENAFWFGASFQNDRTFSIFAGGTIPMGDYRRLRAGVSGNYNLGFYQRQRGLGYEVMLVYEIEN